jgi:hypothetical protein
MDTLMTDALTHPPDDELVLLFYGELPDDDQARLQDHLAGCGECRTSYNALTRTLHLTSSFQAPDPGADFEARVWSRVAPGVHTSRRTSPALWWLGALAASLIAIAGGAWLWTARLSAPDAPVAVAEMAPAVSPDNGTRERVLLAAVDAHLVQTEMLFVELLNAPASEPDAFTYARTAADDLVASGRLYRETARDTGASQLVSMLDELEPVLVEVARSSDAPNAGDIRALRGRIEQDDLLFKVRAVAADIQDRQDRTSSGEGAL